MKIPALIYALCCFALLCPFAAWAEPQSLGHFNGWNAFRYAEKNGAVCYMVLHPVKQAWQKLAVLPEKKPGKKPAKKSEEKRGAAHMMLTLRPSQSPIPTFNYTSGYIFKAGSEAVLRVDKQHFSLFTAKGGAWARDNAGDSHISQALLKAKTAIATGISSKGNQSSDSFVLAGVGQAYHAIQTGCGIK